MRICFLHANPADTHARQRAAALSPHFEEVHYVELAAGGPETKEPLSGVRLHRELAVRRRFKGLALLRLLRQLRPDGVICHFGSGMHFFTPMLTGPWAVAVVSIGGDVLHEGSLRPVHPLYGGLIRLAYRRADFVSAKSRVVRDRVESFGRQGESEVNYWGVNTELFSPGSRAEARVRLGLDPAEALILHPRGILPVRNVDLVVTAFARLLERFPRARLLLPGRSAPESLEKLHEQLRSLGLEERVRLPGLLPRAALADYYRASDLVLSVASSDGFPSTLLEAWACRRPVIAGRLPQIAELLEDGHNGLFCDFDAGSLADRMEVLLSRPEMAERIAEAGRRTALEYGDLRRNAALHAENFSRIISRKSRAGSREVWRWRLAYLPFFLRDQLRLL